jgi:hypothetical protein
VDALLAFGATLVAFRLSADIASRARAHRAAHLVAWSAALASFAAAAGALAWGAADGWSAPTFRVYYLTGGLLTAPLLGTGSLVLAGRRWAGFAALFYVGLAIGIAIAVPLTGNIAGDEIPKAQDALAFWPARFVAVAANSLGTLAVVAVALATFRRRPLGNALILVGVGIAAFGSALGGLGVGALAPSLAAASLLLYAGFVAPAVRPRLPASTVKRRPRDRSPAH